MSDGTDVETVDKNVYDTLAFTTEKGRNVLWISNGGVLVGIFAFKDSGKLIGAAFNKNNPDGNAVMFARNNGDLLTFTKDNANLCTDAALHFTRFLQARPRTCLRDGEAFSALILE